MPSIHDIAARLTRPGLGILAADESIGTMSSRLEAEGITASQDARRDYRGLLLNAPGLAESVSGIIVCDETFHESLDGTPFPDVARDNSVLVGVKVDTGISRLAGADGATITEGLDALGARLADYAAGDAAFAKWRAVIDVTTASDYALETNAHALARYAALCQEHGIVPIVEPEVLCGGDHDIDTCAEVTGRALASVFDHLERQGVDLRGIVLKPNMVTAGLDAPRVAPEEVAARTVAVLLDHVPEDVPGIAFLSGGHPTEAVCEYLAIMNAGTERLPWALTYSFGRALVSDALRAWAGKPENVATAQAILLQNCQHASAATSSVIAAGR
jgi:fructose-bisphosphate aldolase class I